MPVLAIFYGKGVTKDKYDIMVKEVRWKDDHPKGGIFHAAAFDANGDAHVADVWDSQEDLDAFVAGRLIPIFQEHNIPAPQVEVFPVHNIDVYATVDRYKVE